MTDMEATVANGIYSMDVTSSSSMFKVVDSYFDTLSAFPSFPSTILTKHLDGSSADRRSLESRHVSRSDRKTSRTIRQLSYAVIQERRSLFLWMSLQQNLLKFLRQCRMICSKEQKHSLILISMKQQQWMR